MFTSPLCCGAARKPAPLCRSDGEWWVTPGLFAPSDDLLPVASIATGFNSLCTAAPATPHSVSARCSHHDAPSPHARALTFFSTWRADRGGRMRWPFPMPL